MAAGGTLSRAPSPRDRATRLSGLARLAADGTAEAADISEGVTRAIHETLGMRTGPPGRTRGLTGFVYRWVRRIARLIGRGSTAVGDRLGGPTAPREGPTAVAIAVLNGVLGDRLDAEGNPLATPLSFWIDGRPLDLAAPIVAMRAQTPYPASPLSPGESGEGLGLTTALAPPAHLVLTLHGLCLNETCWRTERDGVVVDHGRAAARALGGTAVGVRYNSGRHISENGDDLAVAIQALVDAWPVPVESVTILAHSMGGLVTRAAVADARARGFMWPDRVRAIVFLGTPHHGSPLERIGRWVHELLRAGRFSAPIARAAELRSAGVTDLRWGAVGAADWADRDRFQDAADVRTPQPLPDGIPCFAIAAATVRRRGTLADDLLGDGLVPLRSGLGEHDDPARRLHFTDTCVMMGTGHLDLLRDPEVTVQILTWLDATPPADGGHHDAARA